MKRNIILNLIFIAIFIIFLILSLIIDFFFIIPIICFLPFSFSTMRKSRTYDEKRSTQTLLYTNSNNLEIRYCKRCGGKITEPIAVYCYHCGEKLNSK